MATETFGAFEGRDVQRVTLTGGGLSARVMNWGAAVQDLRLDGHGAPLVLGFETFDPYPEHSPYFGAIAGRHANRIRDGRFTIDGERFQADTNFLGKHSLHGGSAGTGKRLWAIKDHGPDFVTMTYMAAAGEMGFPGNLAMSCAYRVAAGGRLIVTLEATTDAPTLCNLAHHSYFNLDDGGRTPAHGHRMVINAGAYLPVDDELIPTGHVMPVDGTDFDFRFARPIRDGEGAQGYDHNFCLSASRGPLRQAAWVQGAHSGVTMEVWTTEPGVQFYDGARAGRSLSGLGGITYPNHGGFCLEPQIWPDSPNRPYFPQAVLRPGETYRQVSEYRFRLDA
jgi:aldose 1-epimerase